jgi:tetraacyldisaccharide 4'-kinase
METGLILNQLATQLWCAVNRVGRFSYRSGMIPSNPLPCRVISVGNLQAGGSGKTPLVMKISKEALDRGFRVCILSRGYRSAWEKSGGILFPHQKADPLLCGDEVALIRSRLPEVWIGVGSDRISQFKKISKSLKFKNEKPIDLVILDDGFQHFKIRRDLDVIAVTDHTRSEYVFRDEFRAIPLEALVVLTKGAVFPSELQEHPHRVKVHYTYSKPTNSHPYFFVCGLGDPTRAQKMIELAGYSIKKSVFLSDHHPYTAQECKDWVQKAKIEGLKILLTGKDAVKWESLGVSLTDYDALEPELEIEQGEEVWNRLLWPPI